MPVALTLWGDYEAEEGQILADKIHTQPILAAIKIKVTSYHGIIFNPYYTLLHAQQTTILTIVILTNQIHSYEHVHQVYNNTSHQSTPRRICATKPMVNN